MKKRLPAQLKLPLEPYTNIIEKAKGKIRLWSIFFLLIVCLFLVAPSQAQAQECGLSEEKQVSRPDACEICNQTGLPPCDACATSFTVNDSVSYRRGDGESEPPHNVTRDWGGTVTIDPSGVTIPFVGKTEEESEEKYLADYFEGTNEYYENYSRYWLDWVNHAGVLRKLAPMKHQNQLKKEMVQRADDSNAGRGPANDYKIHDYQLRFVGRLCWDAPSWYKDLEEVAKKLGLPAPDISRYCLFNTCKEAPASKQCLAYQAAHHLVKRLPPQYIKEWGGVEGTLSSLMGHFPPEPGEKDFEKKWEEWKASRWFRLWQVVPMVSREDTPGRIIPYLDAQGGDEFVVVNKEAQIEKVPHVARLYEASQETSKLLLPYRLAGGITQKAPEPIIASSQKNVLGEKTLLAQAGPPRAADPCNQPALTDPNNTNDNLCCNAINIRLKGVDTFANPEYEKCRDERVTDCEPTLECPFPFPVCLICYPDPCDEEVTKDVSRQIGIDLEHPYLTQIWDQTANYETSGIFNLFRPLKIPEFFDIDAADKISYYYKDGHIGDGKFYFNHLGGVQLAKEWLIRTLFPY